MSVSLVDPRQSRRPEQARPAAVPGRHLRLVPQPEGLLQIHTAPFRGSFGGVFSQALRAAGLGSTVVIAQFLKGGVEQGVEQGLQLCGRLQWLRPAVPRCLDQPPRDTQERQAVVAIWAHIQGLLDSGQVDLLVLDELGLAAQLGYLDGDEVAFSLERRAPHLDVILTGPAMPASLMAMADQVTELRRGL
jgi:cob(I)alamin adenosyltransferase